MQGTDKTLSFVRGGGNPITHRMSGIDKDISRVQYRFYLSPGYCMSLFLFLSPVLFL
jgi:hypothetical protein